MSLSVIPIERIETSILLLRGEKVLLDRDLATLYGVTTGRLNEAVKRNIDRFPDDFMFEISREELSNLRSQNAISSSHGGRRTLPYAFTEQGVAMLSSVLRSERAVKVNIEIMRAFVKLRRLMGTHVELSQKLQELESKYDKHFGQVFNAIRALMAEPAGKSEYAGRKRRIGFK